MGKLVEYNKNKNQHYVPIVQQWDYEETPPQGRLPALANLLGAKKSDIPHIYLHHPGSSKTIPYPEPLTDVNKFSPELLTYWANKVVIEIEKEKVVNNISRLIQDKAAGPRREMRPKKDGQGMEEVTIQVSEQEIQEAQGNLQKLVQAYEENSSKYLETLGRLEKKNEFSENIDKHHESASMHMKRVQQAYNDEL